MEKDNTYSGIMSTNDHSGKGKPLRVATLNYGDVL